MKKWLGIDFGERRIGLAVGFEETNMAFPRPNIDTKATPLFLEAIAKFAKEERISAVLVGMPRRTDGKIGEKEIAVQKFITELQNVIPHPISTWDEAFSSVVAKERTSHFKTKKKKEQKGIIDSAAAAIVLQDFLENQS